MKPASSSPQLLSALNAEHAALLNFVVLLENEQEMLVGNLTDQLLELSEHKSTAALDINRLTEERRSLLRKNLPQLGAKAICDWLETHSPQGLAAWQGIIALTKSAQQLNQTNGELIQMKLRRNQQLLAALSNAANKANLYGPDGQASFSPGSGRSLGSG